MNIFKHRPLALCCAVILCIYFILSYLPVFIPEHKSEGEEYIEFEITDITYQNGSIAFVDGVATDGNKYHFTLYSVDELRVGDVLCGICSFKEIETSDDFDKVRYYNSKGIWSEAEITSPERIIHKDNVFRDTVESIRSYCQEQFDRYTNENTSALLSALTVGDKSAIDGSLKRDFTRAGLSHMLAISGMHLSVIMGCITVFTDLFNMDRRISTVMIALLCLSFMFVSGMSSSVLRAGLMFLIMSAGELIRRRRDSLTLLFFAVTLIVVVSPTSIYDIGLILSFTSTFGIIVIVGYFMHKIDLDYGASLIERLKYFILVSVVTSVSALCFSFIPLIFFFKSISVVSVLSNLFVAPILTLLLVLIPIFLVLSFWPFALSCIGIVMSLATDVIIWLVTLFSSIPNALVSLQYSFVPYTLIAAAVGVVLTVIIRKRPMYLMPFFCWFLCFMLVFTGYELSFGPSLDCYFYSEAGSDALFIRNGRGTVYLDLGKGSRAAQERAFDMIEDVVCAEELDCWIITHYTNDMVYSVQEYAEKFYIRNFRIPTPIDEVGKAAAAELEYYAENENIGISYYEYGEPFTVNCVELSVYRPITFEESSVFIPTADISLHGSDISYYGLGYFDYGEYRGNTDCLYIGECGTKRKQTASPTMKAENAVVAENNDVASYNLSAVKRELSEEKKYSKIRIS